MLIKVVFALRWTCSRVAGKRCRLVACREVSYSVPKTNKHRTAIMSITLPLFICARNDSLCLHFYADASAGIK